MSKEPAREFPRDDSHLKTSTSADGLRYLSRPNGSPFLGSGSMYSCFLCGTHRARPSLMSRKFVGRNHLVCKEPCTRGSSAKAATSTPVLTPVQPSGPDGCTS